MNKLSSLKHMSTPSPSLSEALYLLNLKFVDGHVDIPEVACDSLLACPGRNRDLYSLTFKRAGMTSRAVNQDFMASSFMFQDSKLIHDLRSARFCIYIRPLYAPILASVSHEHLTSCEQRGGYRFLINLSRTTSFLLLRG